MWGRAVVCRLLSLICLSLLGSGCATVPSGPPPPTLRFGVDVAEEEQAVRIAFERAGYVMVERVAGEHFVAMGFADREGAARGVRVVTARGIALSLDSEPGSAMTSELRFVLRPLPARSIPAEQKGSKGKTLERFFVEELRPNEDTRCVRLYQVSRGGLVTQAGEGDDGAGVCLAESAVGSGTELSVVSDVTVDDLPLPAVPVVPVLMQADPEGKLTREVSEADREAHYRPVLAGLEQALAVAAAKQQAVEVYRRAVEMAYVMGLLGEPVERQKAKLQEVFATLPQERREAAWEDAIMARAEEGW